MKWNTTSRTLSAVAPLALLAGLAMMVTGAKKGCVPVPVDPEPECTAAADCNDLTPPYKCIGYWACEEEMCAYHCGTPEPECQTAKDCEGLPVDINCVGAWTCNQGTCDYKCGEPEPVGCYGDQECPTGTHCNASDVCMAPPGCMPGMACPAVCYGWCEADSNGCKSDADCGPNQMCQPAPCPMLWCAPGTPCDPCPTEGTCVDAPPPYECTMDADCGKGSYCEFEVCADCYCPPGAPCDPAMCGCWGHCAPLDPPPPVTCQSDADCPAGTACTCTADPSCPMCAVCFMQCLPVAPPPYECSADADCGPGQICELVVCQGCACADGAPCDCPPEDICWGTCKDIPEPLTCDTDKDCPSGMLCACGPVPGCPYCDACFMQCVPGPTLQCETDSDCPDGQACVLGPCPLAPCTPEWCPPCYGTCQDLQPPTDQCEMDSDCPAGQACVLGPCPLAPCTPEWCPPCYGTCQDLQPPPPTKCVVSGCSGEICAAQPMDSDCVYNESYQCLKLTTCGNYAPDGSCAWAKTPEYQKCMQQFATQAP